ncbi:MAG TPA: hypothetical protein VGI97_00425 [Gemmatimonadaceae bacterium]|jgi:hypothetical protein
MSQDHGANPRTRDFFGRETEEVLWASRQPPDTTPRCRREHLRDHAKHWGGSVSIPAPPGAVGAIRTMFGDRIAFYACAANRELLEMRGMPESEQKEVI